MTDKKLLDRFLYYFEQYRYEENEYLQSMFCEREFKFVEIEYRDSLTKEVIKNFPIYSGLCLDKKTAAICIFDISTIFNIFFPTEKEKYSFEDLINQQKVICPCCQEEISFNCLVYDNFLAKFHQNIKNQKLDQGVVPKLKLEKVRKSNMIKYSQTYPILNNFSGEIEVQQKVIYYSIDQYQRMNQDLEKEIYDLQQKKAENSQEQQQILEQEIKLKQTIQNMIADEHNRNPDQPSMYMNDQQQPFRILKVGGIDGGSYKSINDNNIYTFKENKLYIGQPSLFFEKRFQIFDLFIKKNHEIERDQIGNQEGNICKEDVAFNINEEEFLGYKSCLVYNSVIVIATIKKIYQIQLVNGQDKNNIQKQLLVEELYTIEREVQDEQFVPQICFNKDNLYLMEYSEQLQSIRIKSIEDLFVYPEEKVIAQPEVYLEVSETSKREKVLLLSDDFTGNIVLLTPDQYFIYDSITNKWQEKDLDLQDNKISFKPKLNFYDYQRDEEFNSQGNKVNFQIENYNSEEEELRINGYDSDEEINNEDILEKIFEDTHKIFALNIKSKEFLISNINQGYVYKLNLNKQKITAVESILNPNKSSENMVYQGKTMYYTINIQNFQMNSDQQDDTHQKDEQNFHDMEDIETKFQDYLQFNNINTQDGKKESLFLENATFCKDLAIFSTSSYFS